MERWLNFGIVGMFILTFLGCKGQTHNNTDKGEQLSNDFDKAMPFAYGMPQNLYSKDTSPGWSYDGQQILLTGTIFERDGKTPAPNVILYYYQTDTHGLYATKADEPRNMPKNRLGQTHGYIRGWIKTGKDGKYAIKTIMPGSYPSRDEAAHVHITVKEAQMKEPYYLDNFVFDDDPLLTTAERRKMENRGGSGVIRFVKEGDLWIGERNLILGLNIPNYPKTAPNEPVSGKPVGEEVSSFTPYHAYGPDKGTRTCPVCKYGWYHGILYFVGNQPNWEGIRQWLNFLETESRKRKSYLKAYFIYGNSSDYSHKTRIQQLEQLGQELQLEHVALTFVPSFEDKASEIDLMSINPEVANTFIIYRRRGIIGSFVDLKPTAKNFELLRTRMDETSNGYFKLPQIENN